MNPKWTEVTGPGVVQADYPAAYQENVIVEQPIPYLFWYGAATTIKEKSTFLLFFIVVLATFCGVCGCLGGLICLIPAAVVASLVRLTQKPLLHCMVAYKCMVYNSMIVALIWYNRNAGLINCVKCTNISLCRL